MKANSKTTLALEHLTKIISDLKSSDCYFLPPERQLCEQVGLSRVTLRRALAILEARGVLIAGKNGRQIRDIDSTQKNSCIWFYAFGHNRIVIPAGYRLWNNLQREAKNHGFDTKLVLYDQSNEINTAPFRNEKDYIIISDNVYGCLDSVMADKKIHMHDRIIGIEASLRENLKYIVTLDDYAVGSLAAHQLLEAGYKYPAYFGLNNGRIAFEKRRLGFIDTLKTAGVKLAGEKCFCAQSSLSIVKEIIFELDELVSSSIDSLFVFSDELIVTIYHLINHIHKIPDDFGLITVNGSGNSVSHYPPITSVSHASKKTAQSILNLIENLNQGRFKEGAVIKIKPSIHDGTSILPCSKITNN